MSNVVWPIIVVILGIAVVSLWLQLRRLRRNSLSPEQWQLVRELLGKEVATVQKEQQDVMEVAASEGKAISTERALQYAAQLKAQYETEGRLEDAQVVDKLLAEIRAKYGSEIPIAEAFHLMKQFERNRGA